MIGDETDVQDTRDDVQETLDEIFAGVDHEAVLAEIEGRRDITALNRRYAYDNSNEPPRADLRLILRNKYDIQGPRIMYGNRIVMNYYRRLGLEPGMKKDALSPDAQKILNRAKLEAKRISDALAGPNRERYERQLREGKFVDEEGEPHRGIIAGHWHLASIQQYVAMEMSEKALDDEIMSMVKGYRIYRDYLKGVKGVGPIMAAILISELNVHDAPHASSFWKFVGMDVVIDPETGIGIGRNKTAPHLIEIAYIDRNGKEATRRGITFNNWLRTKLLGVLATSFVIAGGPYREMYDEYKKYLERRPYVPGRHMQNVSLEAEAAKVPGATKMHRHRMACRYIVKMFLSDLWKTWRAMEGLPVSLPYHEAILGIKHGEGRDYAIEEQYRQADNTTLSIEEIIDA